MKIKRNTIYGFSNKADVDAFLKDCEAQGIKWGGGSSPTKHCPMDVPVEEWVVRVDIHNKLFHGSRSFYANSRYSSLYSCRVEYRAYTTSAKVTYDTDKGTVVLTTSGGKSIKSKVYGDDTFNLEFGIALNMLKELCGNDVYREIERLAKEAKSTSKTDLFKDVISPRTIIIVADYEVANVVFEVLKSSEFTYFANSNTLAEFLRPNTIGPIASGLAFWIEDDGLVVRSRLAEVVMGTDATMYNKFMVTGSNDNLEVTKFEIAK